MERLSKPTVDGVCDEGDLELIKDPVPRTTVVNFLKRIATKTITYNDSFPTRKRALPSKMQVKYVKYIIVTRDMENVGMVTK